MQEKNRKLRDAIRERFPRLYAVGRVSAGFYDRHHAVVSGCAITVLVAFVAWLGFNQHNTESTVTHINNDVSVIKEQSACSPKSNGKPTDRKQCEQNFDTIIHKILTPLQACEFLEHGAPLIQIGGKPIPPVECVKPHPKTAATHITDKVRSVAASSAPSGESTVAQLPPPPAPSHHSPTNGNTGSGGGSHHGLGGTHHASPTPTPIPPPAPGATPESETTPEGPGNSGGAGGSDESNAGGNGNGKGEPKLLPSVTGPVEGVACGALGKLVCAE